MSNASSGQSQSQQQQQQTKNMLSSQPHQHTSKDYQFAPSSMNFSTNNRKGVSTNERQNYSSSPVKITKSNDTSPLLAYAPTQKLNLLSAINDQTYYKKILQSPIQQVSISINGFQAMPQPQNRPANLTQKYIRNYSGFISEVLKNKQDNQYFCAHCKDLLWEPVKCSECSSHYCSSCATKHYTKANKKCNSCQKILVTITVDENITKQLQKISLMCPNLPNGCQAYLSYNSFDLHQQDCRFKKGRGSEQIQKPPLAEFKKRESVPIVPVSSVPVVKKERKDLVSCTHCYKNFPKPVLEQHQNNCPLKLAACKYCKNEVPIVHMKVHTQFRCSKSINCSHCFISIPYEQFSAHQNTCNKYSLTKCSYCDQSFYKQNISDHLPFCTKNPNNLHNKTTLNNSPYKTTSIQLNQESSKKFFSNIAQNMAKTKQQIDTTNGTNHSQNDLTNILIRGIGGSLSPSKVSPCTEKLKFMVMDNMLRSKGRPNEQSIDQDLDFDKTAITKMNTDASISTEKSSHNIQDRIAALLNTSLQMNTTLPLSPLPPQSKFRTEAVQMKNPQSQKIMLSSHPHSQQQIPKQQLQTILHTENPETFPQNIQSSYKLNTLPPSSNPQIGQFLSPQMTSSQRMQQGQKGGNSNNPSVNTILQSYLQKNENNSGRSNSLQMQQTVASSQKVQSTNNIETK